MDQVSEFGEARMAPLSHEQEQLWVQCQLAPQVPADNECVAVTVVGPVDADMLREGLDAVIERHEAWRTVFASRSGVPTQVVLADLRCGWSVADLDGAAEAEQEAAARRL